MPKPTIDPDREITLAEVRDAWLHDEDPNAWARLQQERLRQMRRRDVEEVGRLFAEYREKGVNPYRGSGKRRLLVFANKEPLPPIVPYFVPWKEKPVLDLWKYEHL